MECLIVESQALCQSSDIPNNITYYKMSRDYKFVSFTSLCRPIIDLIIKNVKKTYQFKNQYKDDVIISDN